MPAAAKLPLPPQLASGTRWRKSELVRLRVLGGVVFGDSFGAVLHLAARREAGGIAGLLWVTLPDSGLEALEFVKAVSEPYPIHETALRWAILLPA